MAKRKRSNALVDVPMGDWEAEEDLRCFMRVCEIKKDPKRLKRVNELAKERLDEAAKVAAVTSKEGYSG